MGNFTMLTASIKHLVLVGSKLYQTGDGDEPTRFYCCLLGNKQTLALLAYWHSHGPYQVAIVGEGWRLGGEDQS